MQAGLDVGNLAGADLGARVRLWPGLAGCGASAFHVELVERRERLAELAQQQAPHAVEPHPLGRLPPVGHGLGVELRAMRLREGFLEVSHGFEVVARGFHGRVMRGIVEPVLQGIEVVLGRILARDLIERGDELGLGILADFRLLPEALLGDIGPVGGGARLLLLGGVAGEQIEGFGERHDRALGLGFAVPARARAQLIADVHHRSQRGGGGGDARRHRGRHHHRREDAEDGGGHVGRAAGHAEAEKVFVAVVLDLGAFGRGLVVRLELVAQAELGVGDCQRFPRGPYAFLRLPGVFLSLLDLLLCLLDVFLGMGDVGSHLQMLEQLRLGRAELGRQRCECLLRCVEFLTPGPDRGLRRFVCGMGLLERGLRLFHRAHVGADLAQVPGEPSGGAYHVGADFRAGRGVGPAERHHLFGAGIAEPQVGGIERQLRRQQGLQQLQARERGLRDHVRRCRVLRRADSAAHRRGDGHRLAMQAARAGLLEALERGGHLFVFDADRLEEGLDHRLVVSRLRCLVGGQQPLGLLVLGDAVRLCPLEIQRGQPGQAWNRGLPCLALAPLLADLERCVLVPAVDTDRGLLRHVLDMDQLLQAVCQRAARGSRRAGLRGRGGRVQLGAAGLGRGVGNGRSRWLECRRNGAVWETRHGLTAGRWGSSGHASGSGETAVGNGAKRGGRQRSPADEARCSCADASPT